MSFGAGGTWTSRDFAEAILRLKKHEYKLFYEKDDPEARQYLENLRSFLVSGRAFLLRLLKIRTSVNMKPLLSSFGRFSTLLMSFSTDPISRNCPKVITNTSLLTRVVLTAR